MNETKSQARPTWDKYFMELARAASLRATCDRKQIGCIFVDPVDHQVLVTGYNGSTRGAPHCSESGHILMPTIEEGIEKQHCVRVVHAESNAIAQAARRGIALNGSAVYLTHFPCQICAKLMIQVGVTEIIYEEPFKDELAEKFLKEAGLIVRKVGASISEWIVPGEEAEEGGGLRLAAREFSAATDKFKEEIASAMYMTVAEMESIVSDVAAGKESEAMDKIVKLAQQSGITAEEFARNVDRAAAASDPTRTPLDLMLARVDTPQFSQIEMPPDTVDFYGVMFEAALTYGLSEEVTKALLHMALASLDPVMYPTGPRPTLRDWLIKFDARYQEWKTANADSDQGSRP